MSPIRKALARFFYVALPAGVVKHRVFKMRGNPVEGDLTQCGIAVKPRWRWITPISADAKFLRRCRRCESVPAPASINVERVRATG